jgi:hypothetical protein
MKAKRSSETSIHTRSTRRHIPEDGILHSHRRENLKSYTDINYWLRKWILKGVRHGYHEWNNQNKNGNEERRITGNRRTAINDGPATSCEQDCRIAGQIAEWNPQAKEEARQTSQHVEGWD